MKKRWKQAIVIAVISCAAAAAIGLIEYKTVDRGLTDVERNPAGGGKRTEELIVEVEGALDERPMEIEVEERRYQAEEIKQVFEKSIGQLDTLILGDNQSLDHVDHSLNLLSAIPGTGVAVEWEMSRPDLLLPTGEIRTENLAPDGEPIELRAYLKYDEEQVMCVIDAVLYQPALSPEDSLIEAIKSRVKETNKSTIENEKLLLPTVLDGKQIIWKQSSNRSSLAVLLLGLAVSVYLVMEEKQRKRKEEKEKKEQMLRDYPEILGKLVLLMGAGMPVAKAWSRMVHSYQEEKSKKSTRYAYEEMTHTYHEQQSKMGEGESYERFGRRCNLPEYVKLGAMLSQNLRKGTGELARVLTLESANAFAARKLQAKRKGEEAGTKLLLPMFLMLAVVLIIIIIPAFLSFQL